MRGVWTRAKVVLIGVVLAGCGEGHVDAGAVCSDGVCQSGETCANCEVDCRPCSKDVFRAFSDDSYWNTPMPVDAPVDPNNDLYIADAKNPSLSWPPYLRLAGAPDHNVGYKWAYPIYWVKPGDPDYEITPARYGATVRARIPRGSTPQAGSDGGLIVYDLTGNQVIELWKAAYNASSDHWQASSTKRWVLDSNGLHRKAAGSDSKLNDGHRGVASPIRAIRMDEVLAGAIHHRLECFWHATGRPNDSTPWYYWPMVGYESGKGGIVPEGLVLRIKPSVDLSSRGLSRAALVIARAMQEYGCMIGDNEGGTKNSLKLERDKIGVACAGNEVCTWKEVDPGLSLDSLQSIRWDEYEFVRGGFDPR